MTHAKTVSRLQSSFGTAISFLRMQRTPFILGEVGSAIGRASPKCTPSMDLYRSLGAALWTVDFML
jgi:hypothetical protein